MSEMSDQICRLIQPLIQIQTDTDGSFKKRFLQNSILVFTFF